MPTPSRNEKSGSSRAKMGRICGRGRHLGDLVLASSRKGAPKNFRVRKFSDAKISLATKKFHKFSQNPAGNRQNFFFKKKNSWNFVFSAKIFLKKQVGVPAYRGKSGGQGGVLKFFRARS